MGCIMLRVHQISYIVPQGTLTVAQDIHILDVFSTHALSYFDPSLSDAELRQEGYPVKCQLRLVPMEQVGAPTLTRRYAQGVANDSIE